MENTNEFRCTPQQWAAISCLFEIGAEVAGPELVQPVRPPAT
ncbi:hypothetical protein [Arthrobacter sp. SLBN-53]|nr:hypothetical protein [Arthrobacter sp. SLBN-53]